MPPRPLPIEPGTVLLVRLSSIGDVVMSLPLALALRRRWPRTRLVWAVEPDAAPILEGHPCRAEALLVPRRGGLATRGAAVRALRALRPDVVFDPQGNAKSAAVGRLASRGAPIVGLHRDDVRERANLAVTTHRAPPSPDPHGARRALGLLRALGDEPAAGPPDYGLAATEEERADAARRLAAAGLDDTRPVVLVHPGKLRDVRTWPAEPLAAFVRDQAARGRAVIVEGPDRRRPPEARAILKELFADGTAADLTRGLPLRTLVGLLDHLARRTPVDGRRPVLVSPDTLLPHLAAALGLPVVLLAGPQDPQRTGPLGCGAVTVVDAWDGLECAPCRKRRCHFAEDRACMVRIEPAAVAAAVDRAVRS